MAEIVIARARDFFWGAEGRSGFLHRFAAGLGIAAVLLGVYQLVAAEVQPGPWDLSTPLDQAIPFLPWTVWFYLPGYAMMFVVAVVVIEDWATYLRTAAALVVAAIPAWTTHALFPVAYPRPATPDGPGLDAAMMRWLHAFDPPENTFPSMHVAAAGVIMLATWPVRRDAGVITSVLGSLMMVSVLTTKQHFLADILGGWVMAGLAWALVLRRPRGA